MRCVVGPLFVRSFGRRHAELSFLNGLSASILAGRQAKVKPREVAMQVDIVSDVICPWCYIGKRRLERALALRPDLLATRSWRAFQLNPEMPTDGISRELYLTAKYGDLRSAAHIFAGICAAGRNEGIGFAF